MRAIHRSPSSLFLNSHIPIDLSHIKQSQATSLQTLTSRAWLLPLPAPSLQLPGLSPGQVPGTLLGRAWPLVAPVLGAPVQRVAWQGLLLLLLPRLGLLQELQELWPR